MVSRARSFAPAEHTRLLKRQTPGRPPSSSKLPRISGEPSQRACMPPFFLVAWSFPMSVRFRRLALEGGLHLHRRSRLRAVGPVRGNAMRELLFYTEMRASR